MISPHTFDGIAYNEMLVGDVVIVVDGPMVGDSGDEFVIVVGVNHIGDDYDMNIDTACLAPYERVTETDVAKLFNLKHCDTCTCEEAL